MTYARSRLYLGMSSVGTLVVASVVVLSISWLDAFPALGSLFDANAGWLSLAGQVALLIAGFFLLMTPFDFLGGYWLPRRFQKSELTLNRWLTRYLVSIVGQLTIYTLVGVTLILSYRTLGLAGLLAISGLAMLLAISIRDLIFTAQHELPEKYHDKLQASEKRLEEWKLDGHCVVVVDRQDQGFTGGIIGWPQWEKIVIPRRWLQFDADVLATILARRILAIRSGDYLRGMLGAVVWNLAGLTLASLLTTSGVVHVGGLIDLICWFTLYSFVGLLTLPTLSRTASHRMDQMLRVVGIDKELLRRSAQQMDRLQDDEPERPTIVETIFHPIPSVNSRASDAKPAGLGAWQIARTMLFTSWGCLGLLSRAVHCNIGRPELWLMLPSD